MQAEILRLAKRDVLPMRGHPSYVQGVAWDPRGQLVITQSADRSVKVHQVLSHTECYLVMLSSYNKTATVSYKKQPPRPQSRHIPLPKPQRVAAAYPCTQIRSLVSSVGQFLLLMAACC